MCLRPHDRSENFYGDRNRFEVIYAYMYCIYNTSWLPVLRYGKSVFTKESQGTEFFVVVALLCKFWSTSKLMYI